MISLDDVLKTVLIFAIATFLLAMSYFVSKLLWEIRKFVRDARLILSDFQKVSALIGSTTETIKGLADKTGFKKIFETLGAVGSVGKFFGRFLNKKKEEK